MHSEERKDFLEDRAVPLWQRILNLDSSRWERSHYAKTHEDGSEGAHRLRDLSILREMAPGIYQAAVGEVKEYNEALFETRGQIRKYRLGRKIGVIPMVDMALHPELANDPKAQDKYFTEHPELKTHG